MTETPERVGNGPAAGLEGLDAGAGRSSRRDVARFVFRNLPLFSSIVLLVTGLTAVLAYVTPPTYKATGLVLIERGKSPTLRSDPVQYQLEFAEVLTSEIGILESDTVAEVVVDRLGLASLPERRSLASRVRAGIRDFLVSVGLSSPREPRDTAIRRFHKRMKVKQLTGSSLLSISYRESEPDRAAQVARAIVDVYIERHREIFSDNTAAFFKERIRETEADLDAMRLAASRETDPSRIDSLELVRSALETTYKLYRERWDRAKADEAGDKSLVNVRVVDYPSVPLRPQLSRLIQILAGFLGSLALGLSLAFLRDYFDHAIHLPEEIVRHTGLTVLGSVRQSPRAHSHPRA